MHFRQFQPENSDAKCIPLTTGNWLTLKAEDLVTMTTDKHVNNLLIFNSNEIHRVCAEKFAKSAQQFSAYYVFRQRNNTHFSCCHGNKSLIKFQI